MADDRSALWYQRLLALAGGRRSGFTGFPAAAGRHPLLIRGNTLYAFHKIKGRSAIFLPALSGGAVEMLGFDVQRSIDAVASQLRCWELPSTVILALRAGAAADLGNRFQTYYRRTPFLLQADPQALAITARLAMVRDLARLQDSIRRSITMRIRRTVDHHFNSILRHDLLLIDGMLCECGPATSAPRPDDFGPVHLPCRTLETCKARPMGTPAQVIFEPLGAALQPIVEHVARDLGRRMETLRTRATSLARSAPRPSEIFYESRSRLVRWQAPNKVLIEARSRRPWAIRRGDARYGFAGYAIEVVVDVSGRISDPRVLSPQKHSYVSAEGTGRVCIPMLSRLRHRWRRLPLVEIVERLLRTTEQILLLGATANDNTPLQGWHHLRSQLLPADADIPPSRTFTASTYDPDDSDDELDEEYDDDVPF